jgi:tRNA threonylcarbamoyladenosine biosynthesis protein TsaE
VTTTVETASAAETEALAARLAGSLVPGDVVTVSGELGSGKTTFVRGACRALGVTAPVTSPTYTIGHRYEGDPDVTHLDLFRFTAVSQAEWAELEPYFEHAIAFVEWPEAAGSGLPEVRVAVRLEHVDAERRRIRLDASDVALVERLARAHPGLRHGD